MGKTTRALGLALVAAGPLVGCSSNVNTERWEIRASCPDGSVVDVNTLDEIHTDGSEIDVTFVIQCLSGVVQSPEVSEPLGVTISSGPVIGDIVVGSPWEDSTSIFVDTNYEAGTSWGAARQNPTMSIEQVGGLGEDRLGVFVTIRDVLDNFSPENITIG